MADVKSGVPEVSAPVYSHLAYDIVPGEQQVVRQPDIVIVEGLNVLQTGSRGGRRPMFVSDFFDFSIYVDADEADIEQWYVERFLTLRETVFQNPSSYFHRYAELSPEDAVETARAASGRRSTWSTCARTSCRRASAPISSSRRGAITPCGACGCGSCSGQEQPAPIVSDSGRSRCDADAFRDGAGPVSPVAPMAVRPAAVADRRTLRRASRRGSGRLLRPRTSSLQPR